jgi:hypothetical protein
LLLAGLATQGTWISTAAAAEPVTLVSTKRPITNFVQDDSYLAWSVCPGDPRVTVRSLASGVSRTFSAGGPCSVTDGASYFGGGDLALARSRVLWLRYEVSEMDSLYQSAETAALSDPRVRAVQFFWDTGFAHPMAGAGTTLVYGFLDDINDEPQGIKRVHDGTATRIPGVVRGAVLAVAGRRIALAPARAPSSWVAARDGRVEVRDAKTGALVTTFNPTGTVVALALTRARVAVLVRAASGARRIERYSVATGSLVGSTWVSRRTANRLDMSGSRILYRTGTAIRLLDADTGIKRLLARTTSIFPIGVSIEGARVAWATNRWEGRRLHGEIRALWVGR